MTHKEVVTTSSQAMARALEDVTGPLQGLLATAAGCHARVLRAALVRLTARAAGETAQGILAGIHHAG